MLLRAALNVAHHYPVQVVQGDLRTDLLALVTRMPEDATRVAFYLFFFIKTRNRAFVVFTAYVLAGLVAGVLLGRIG